MTVTLDKTGSSTAASTRASPGDLITYTFTVTNTGNVTLTRRRPSPTHVGRRVSCPAATPATLAPGETDHLHRQLRPDPGRHRRRPGRQHRPPPTAARPARPVRRPTATRDRPVPQVVTITPRQDRHAPHDVAGRPAAPTPATRSPTPSTSPTPATSPSTTSFSPTRRSPRTAVRFDGDARPGRDRPLHGDATP